MVLRNPEKTRKPEVENRKVEEKKNFSNTNISLIEKSPYKRTCTKSRPIDCSCDNECDKCISDSRNSVDASCDKVQKNVGIDVRRAALTRRLTSQNDEEKKGRSVPSTSDQTNFKRILNNSTSMVFHKTGLPLMSSPAPVRKGKTCFDFDASIGSVTDIKR